MSSLRHRLEHARDSGIDDEPARAAETILALVGALSAHDRFTRGHSERVRALTDLIAEELKLPAADRDRLRWASLLHDIGKLETSPKLLNKPERLDPDEWAIIHRHPENGARLAAPLTAWLGSWAATIEQHHERWDGSGYPNGLQGNAICLGARIVAVADAFEVMTAARAYKKPMKAPLAREELTRCAGTQFDPDVVRAFVNVSIGPVRWGVGPLTWLVQVPFVSWVPRALEKAAAVGGHGAGLVGAAAGVAALSAGPGLAGAPAVDATAPTSSVPAHGTAVVTTAPKRARTLPDVIVRSPSTTTPTGPAPIPVQSPSSSTVPAQPAVVPSASCDKGGTRTGAKDSTTTTTIVGPAGLALGGSSVKRGGPKLPGGSVDNASPGLSAGGGRAKSTGENAGSSTGEGTATECTRNTGQTAR